MNFSSNNYLIGIKYDNPNFIYFSIPKTGCTSVKWSIANFFDINVDPKKGIHSTKLNSIEVLSKRDLPTHFKFAFVRNPWDRVVSLYNDKICKYYDKICKKYNYDNNFITKKKIIRQDFDDPYFGLKYTDVFYAGMSFKEFVKKICSISDDDANKHFKSQYTFIYDKNGDIAVDFLGRFENFEKDFNYISSKISNDFVMFHKNISKHEHYRAYYDEVTQKMVEERYEKDLRLFNYKF